MYDQCAFHTAIDSHKLGFVTNFITDLTTPGEIHCVEKTNTTLRQLGVSMLSSLMVVKKLLSADRATANQSSSIVTGGSSHQQEYLPPLKCRNNTSEEFSAMDWAETKSRPERVLEKRVLDGSTTKYGEVGAYNNAYVESCNLHVDEAYDILNSAQCVTDQVPAEKVSNPSENSNDSDSIEWTRDFLESFLNGDGPGFKDDFNCTSFDVQKEHSRGKPALISAELEVRNDGERHSDKEIRKSWKKGSKVRHYSTSEAKWLDAEIIGITQDEEVEWLDVRWWSQGQEWRKQVKRFSDNIIPRVQNCMALDDIPKKGV